MSTYFNPAKPTAAGNYSDCPALVTEFLNYSQTIRGLSPRTVNAYYIDLRTFFKFLMQYRGLERTGLPFEKIEIAQADLEFIGKVSKTEIYDYLYFVTRERDNASVTRSRKLSALKGFFKYLTSKTGRLQRNPMDDVEMPAQKKRLPKYLSLEESVELLNSVQNDFKTRDYCMITLFLNSGLRLSELVSLNVNDIKNDTMRVIGKGDKERIVYLNKACLRAIEAYLAERAKVTNLRDTSALFVSRKTGKRLTARRVQQLVSLSLQAAGLAGKGYSVHKLRHTAATLMYQYGHVDLLSLKEILGHADVSTTQIYTHLGSDQLKKAALSSPLSSLSPGSALTGSKDNDVENKG